MTDIFTVHHAPERRPDTRVPDPHQDTYSKTIFGFWVYLMTDAIIFASLFITYAVLSPNTFGGPSSQDLFSLPVTFTETMTLLLSSLTCGLAMLAATKSHIKGIIGWLVATFILGATFLVIELSEFAEFISEGYTWKTSAFLSSFFTLVGTHGFHVTIGLLWLTVMIVQLFVHGLIPETFRRLAIFNIFWHFLDLIWIFVFTFVYLVGVI